jgi:hypothetical protein
MKISKETGDVLKNFATINMSLLFKKGNTLRTVSPQKSVLAEAKIGEEFPREFAIFDMNQFLSTFSAFEDPDLNFNEKNLQISNGSGGTAYLTYAAPENIITPPDKQISLPSVEVSFTLQEKAMSSSLKMAGILDLPEVAFVGRDGVAYLSAIDSRNQGSNKFEMPVGETKNTFTMIFKVENLKMLSRDYNVKISAKGISHWSTEDGSIQYWVATETSSKFES